MLAAAFNPFNFLSQAGREYVKTPGREFGSSVLRGVPALTQGPDAPPYGCSQVSLVLCEEDAELWAVGLSAPPSVARTGQGVCAVRFVS